MKQNDDPTIERIRKARHSISEEHDHNPRKVVDYYVELQKKYEERLLGNAEKESPAEPIKALLTQK